MTDNYINFKSQRELGEIITDTFKFLRENYKLLFSLILKIAGPMLIILSISLGYYYYIGGGNPFLESGIDENLWQFFIVLFVLVISFLLFFVLLQGTVLHFIRSYIENKGQVIKTEVYSGVKRDFGSLLGVGIIVPILICIGLLFCVLPGIYLWVPLSFCVPLVVFGRKGAFESIEDSFALIKDNWWMTFLSLFVMALLVYFIGLIFQIPMFIYLFVKMISVVQEGSAANPEAMFDWLYIVLSLIASIAQYLLYSILIIATAFIYYSLDEKRNFTGSYETISNLGSSDKN